MDDELDYFERVKHQANTVLDTAESKREHYETVETAVRALAHDQCAHTIDVNEVSAVLSNSRADHIEYRPFLDDASTATEASRRIAELMFIEDVEDKAIELADDRGITFDDNTVESTENADAGGMSP